MTTHNQTAKKTAPIEFALFAPTIKWAALCGNFSNWQDIELKKGPDGYFRTQFELADGEYEYKFHVQSNSPWQFGKRVFITDPLATQVNEAKNDNGVICIRNGQRILDAYQWQHDDAPLPANHELVIYEIHIGDFATNIQGVVDKLDYLVQLGVNALELMPVATNPGRFSWGYTIRHFLAMENSYGTSGDFKRLIDQCHARGIRVILDMVFNQAEKDSPLTQIDYKYWIVEHNTDESNFGPKFDYEHWDAAYNLFPAREFSYQVATYWTHEYHLDGVRLDGTFLIRNLDFLRTLGEKIKQAAVREPFYLVAEHIPVDPAIIGPDMPMEGLWFNNFLYQIMANLHEKEYDRWQAFDWERTKSGIQPALADLHGPTAAVLYIANHDQSHLRNELEHGGVSEDKIWRKAKLGYATTLTAVGVPLIWMGDEFGQPGERSSEKSFPVQFNLLNNAPNRDLCNYVGGLARLRRQTAALKTDNLEFTHLDTDNKLLVWKRWADDGSVVMVVANFGENSFESYNVPNFPDGGWHEYTFNYDIETQGGQLIDRFGPNECKIYLKQV